MTGRKGGAPEGGTQSLSSKVLLEGEDYEGEGIGLEIRAGLGEGVNL